MNSLVSIIIPVYNHANTLKKSVLTAVGQSYRPIEIIIVNDGSTDNFKEIIKDILQQPSVAQIDVQVIEQQNKGAPTAKNVGFEHSKGDYVIFWDADTIADNQMIQIMINALKKDANASFAYCDFKFGWKKIFCRPFDFEKLKLNNYIDTTSLIKRHDFCGFDQSIKRFQDWDLWLTMAGNNKTGVYVPELLYKKLVGRRKGISRWLPKIFFILPWKIKAVRDHESARNLILQKHKLI